MKSPRAAIILGVVGLSAGAVNILNGFCYEHPQFMVLAAGLFASGVIAFLR